MEYKRASQGHFRQYECASIHVHACDPVCITYRSAGGWGGGGQINYVYGYIYKSKCVFATDITFRLFQIPHL